MLSAIVFDAYGTLISTGNGSIEACEKILSKNNRSDICADSFYMDWKKYHRMHIDTLGFFKNEEAIFHRDLNKLYSDYNINGNADEDVEIMLDTLGRRFAFPETKRVLDTLSETYTVCIGSVTDTLPLMNDLERNNLSVSRIYTSENLKCYKPCKLFYEHILDDLGINPNEVLFVGDSLTDDILGPQSIGMKTCWINRKKEVSDDIIPDFEIETLDGLLTVVEKLERE